MLVLSLIFQFMISLVIAQTKSQTNATGTTAVGESKTRMTVSVPTSTDSTEPQLTTTMAPTTLTQREVLQSTTVPSGRDPTLTRGTVPTVPTTTTTTTQATTTAQLSADSVQKINSIVENGIPSPSELLAGINNSAIPKLSFSTLARNCEDISPNIRAPPNHGNATLVQMDLAIDRFLGIADVAKSVDVMGSLFIRWAVTTCRGNVLHLLDGKDRVMVTSKDSFWHPSILFSSGSNDVGLVIGNWYDELEVVYEPLGSDNFLVYFFWVLLGKFSSNCPLLLDEFPFDDQICKFVFSIKQSNEFVQFHPNSKILIEGISENSDWSLLDSNVTVYQTMPGIQSKRSSIEYQIHLVRKPHYVMINIMGPVFLLVVIELVTLLLPPEMPDRSTFYCVILLALMVVQTSILQTVPRTPQRVLMSDFTLVLMLLSAVLCVYSLFICWVANNGSSQQSAKKSILCLRIKVCRVCDCLIFIISITVLALASAYVAMHALN